MLSNVKLANFIITVVSTWLDNALVSVVGEFHVFARLLLTYLLYIWTALDQSSERMSSDVSDDAMRDDTNSPSGGGGSSNGAWDDNATGNGNSSTRRKRMRSSFKHHQLKIMKSHFQLNHNPDAKELREIALKTGLMTRVIQVSDTW